MKTVILFFILIIPNLVVAEPKTKKVFRKILAHKPINFSPHVLEDEYSVQVMRQCLLGLLIIGDDNKLENGIATNWTLSRDKRKYVFTIRDNLKYSDGTDFKPEDFLASIESLLRGDSVVKTELSVILGADEFTRGSAKTIKGIQVVNPKTIEITLKKPFPPFLSLLSATEAGVLKKEDVQKLRESKVAAFASLGPYFVKEISEKKIVLAKNPNYHRKDSVYFDEIQYDLEISEKEALQGFAEGKYHDIYPYSVPDDLAQKTGALKVPTFSAMTWYLQFNLNKPPVNRMEFRKLLYKHFDFDAFLEKAGKPAHFRAYGLIPRGFLGFKEKREFKAKLNDRMVVKQAKCEKTQPCVITIYHPYLNLDEAIKVGFKSFNERFPEVKVNVELEERTKWYERFVSGDYTMVAVGNASRHPDTSLFLKYLASPVYHPGLKRKEILKFLNASLETDDRTKRMVYFEQADDLLFDQMGIIPLFFGESPYRWVSGKLYPFLSPLLGYSKVRIENLKEKDTARASSVNR